MKLKTNPIRWRVQVILVICGFLLVGYALISGGSWAEWSPILLTFILIACSIEYPLLASNEESSIST